MYVLKNMVRHIIDAFVKNDQMTKLYGYYMSK